VRTRVVFSPRFLLKSFIIIEMKCGFDKCFMCIREGTDLSWSYECNDDVLSGFYKKSFDKHARKMIVGKEIKDSESMEELKSLIDEVMTSSRQRFEELGTKMSQREAEVIGDSLARLYIFLMIRDRIISMNDLRPLAPVIRRATKRSHPASALAYMLDGIGLKRPFPKCWLNLVSGRSEENNGNGSGNKTRNVRSVD
jgi:hypothetical protein